MLTDGNTTANIGIYLTYSRLQMAVVVLAPLAEIE